MKFHITVEAAEFIRNYVLGTNAVDEMVMVVVPAATIGGVWEEGPPSPDALARVADSLRKQRPPLRWEIGGLRRDRVQAKDCTVIDGINVYLPKELEGLLEGRVLKLEAGVLRFDPDLGPVEVPSR